MHRGTLIALAALMIAPACGDSGPEGGQATQMTISSTSSVTWPNLCKRVTLRFLDDGGNAHRYGRADALGLAVSGASAYNNNKCSGFPIASVLAAPDNSE